MNFIILFMYTFCKDLCTPGASMCISNMLSICDENGHLITTDCPEDTECNLEDKKMSCLPNTNEKSKKSKNIGADIMQQLVKLSHDKEFVKSLKKHLEKTNKKEEDNQSTENSEENDIEDDDGMDEQSENENFIKSKQENEPKTNRRKNGNGNSKMGKKKLQKVKVVHNNGENGNNNNKQEPSKIATITYHKVIEKQQPASTVTVYRTIIQKDNVSNVDVQLIQASDKTLQPAVKSQIGAHGPYGETSQNQNGNNNISGMTSQGNNGNGNGGTSHKNGNLSSSSGTSTSGKSQSTSQNSFNKSSQNGAAKSSLVGGKESSQVGGSTAKPTQNGGGSTAKPAQNGGGSASKPAQNGGGGGASKPAQGGGGASKPAQVGGGGASKPAQGGGGSTSNTSQNGEGSQKPKDKDGASKPDGSSGENGGGNITEDQINEAMSKSSFSPNPEYVQAVVKGTNEEFTDIKMAAMFLAQLAHESGGFQHIEEIDCAGSTKCADQYGGSAGAPGKSYHGRGFIQLSWPENYKAAGEALGMGDELFNNPEKVAEDVDIGVKVSIWFWKTNVENAPGVSDYQFGATTKAINGALECTGSNVDKSKKRYEIYKSIAEVLGISELADESGCY